MGDPKIGKAIETYVWMVSFFLLVCLFGVTVTQMNSDYQRALALRPVSHKIPVYIGSGALRYNPKSDAHIIIGYEVENCVVEAPPQYNVIASSYFSPSPGARVPYLMSIGGIGVGEK